MFLQHSAFSFDCTNKGCDASVILASPGGKAEKDHLDNLSLAGDGFDTVIKAKAAVDINPQCIMSHVRIYWLWLLGISLPWQGDLLIQLYWEEGMEVWNSWENIIHSQCSKLQHTSTRLGFRSAQHPVQHPCMVALSGTHTIDFSHCCSDDEDMEVFYNTLSNLSESNEIGAVKLAFLLYFS